MTNEEKAKEIADFLYFKLNHIDYNTLKRELLEMAQWKDEQLANCIERLEKDYIKNSGKGLLSNEEIAAKLATLRRIKEEMKGGEK